MTKIDPSVLIEAGWAFATAIKIVNCVDRIFVPWNETS
jgi:hypothetical protein